MAITFTYLMTCITTQLDTIIIVPYSHVLSE